MQYSLNMKNCKLIFAAAAVLMAASSCVDKAQIKGKLSGAPDAEVVVTQLSGSSFNVLDTVKTDAAGEYSYKMKIEAGQPEFVYIFKGDTKVASLLLQKGDKVKVVSDTLGQYSVEGSEESAKLKQVEDDYASFIGRFESAVEEGDGPRASREYVDYYRSRVKYIMENSKSLTAIPVLYQKVNESFPVFSQSTDALHFQHVHDSLMTVYPKSRYVAGLAREAERRANAMTMDLTMQNARETTFPEIELPSMDGSKVSLGSVDSKAVLVYFWQASDASQKMFNQDVLLPLYNQYHPKGLEIYAVSLDTDKGVWASAVKSQNLPWINVCDGRGAASPAAVVYNISSLPVAHLIVDGRLSPVEIKSENDLRRVLAANL